MAANDNIVGCGKDFTIEELLSGAIGKDSSGKPTLRMYESQAVANSNFIACGNPVDSDNLNGIIKNLFCLDSNGDICVRISILP